MKKSFFKKLSFVLALAMVMSVIAPAASAFAAAGPKLSSTKKYLHLDVEDLNEYNFNVANKKSGWKYLWESSDEDVVVVNEKNGVATATGVGTAKVTVFITDKDDEEVTDLTATVVVRDNIKELTITNKPEGDKLAIGAENNFNRDFVTNSGSSKVTSAITRWSVNPADGATINDSGVFVATKAGKYTVTATAYQSKEKYAAGVALPGATDSYALTVAASMTGVKQVNLSKFAVTFDTAVAKADVESKLGFYYMAGTSKVKLNTIKGVSMDADSKVATVEIFGTFTEGSTYVVDYPEMEAVSFVAAKTNPLEVVRMEITTSVAQIAVPEDVKISLYNANGVDIANADLLSRVELTTSNNATYVQGKQLTMYMVNDTTTLSATYHSFEYDENGKEKGVVTAEKLVTCVEQKTDNAGLLNSYTVAGAPKDANFGWTKTKIAAGDSSLYLFVQLKGKKSNGWEDLYTSNAVKQEDGSYITDNTDFKFTSTNQDVLVVNDNYIYPVKEGSASVVVTYKDVVVGAASITVVPSRKVATLSVDNRTISVSNDKDVVDKKTVVVAVKDQLGDNYGNFTYSVKYNGTSADGALLLENTEMFGWATHEVRLNFNGANKADDADPATDDRIKEGTYTYTVSITDNNGYATTAAYITVNVIKANADTQYRYAIETSSKEYDVKIETWETWGGAWKTDVSISLFGYSSNNVRTQRVDLSNDANFTFEIKDPDNKVYVSDGLGNFTYDGKAAGDVGADLNKLGRISKDGTNLKFSLVSGPSVIENLKTGTYTMTAKDATGKVVATNYFIVKNTQPAPVVAVKSLYSDKAVALDAINDCIKFTIGGEEFKAVAYDGKIVGNTIVLNKVTVDQTIGDDKATIKHSVNASVVLNFKPAE